MPTNPPPFDPIVLDAHNPGPMTGSGNHTYLIVGAKGSAAIVDAGVGEQAHLADLAAALDSRGARLRLVVATHGHRDHVAGARAIQAAWPHAAFAKCPWPGEAEHDVAWSPLADNDEIALDELRLTVLHTPGHSPDHVALWHAPTRTAVTGDLVVKGSSVMIHTSRGGNLAEYMASLERLRGLRPSRLLPAHGPAIDDPDAVLAGYLAHRRDRERQVIDALKSGHATVQAIAESIYDGLDETLMRAARENVRAHLDKLRVDGVAAVEETGRWRIVA